MMVDVSINYVAVLVAAVVAYVVGFVWHTALGKSMKAAVPSRAKAKDVSKSPTAHIGQFILIVLMSYGLAFSLAFSQASTPSEASMGAFWIWLTFVATIMFGEVLWKGQSIKMFAMNSGFYLVALVVMANVILMMG